MKEIDLKMADDEVTLPKREHPDGQIKACLFNLIVYGQEERRAAYLQELERTILEKFPCRIIFIEHSFEDPSRLELVLNTDIRSKASRKFTYDEILIKAGTQTLSRVPFLVIPNLVPDLPIYLLWGQDPTADKEILPKLEDYATKLIFDSECSSCLQSFAKEMLNFFKIRKTNVMDLNWASISGWRDALANVFNTQDDIECLKTVPTIRITYNKPETKFVRSHETKAIYLQAWLATRLNWTFKSNEMDGQNRVIRYKNSQGETVITLIPTEDEALAAGAIIDFEALHGGNEFQINRRQMQPKVTVHTTHNDRCELPYTLSLPDIKQRTTFMREIFFQTINDHYRSMLEMIAQTEWEYTASD